jgi:WD40 repeat protein
VEAHPFLQDELSHEPLWNLTEQPCDQLVFSPDGKELAVVDWNNDRVLILQSRTGREITRIAARQCYAAAWSPDGKRIAFTVMDDIHVADTSRWDTEHVLRGHYSTATMLAWSPDGRMIASTSKDRSVCLWNAIDGKQRHRLLGHRFPISWATFSPDGRTLITSDNRGLVNIWHAQTGELIGALWDDPHDQVLSFAFTQQGRFLIAQTKKGAAVFNTSGNPIVESE